MPAIQETALIGKRQDLSDALTIANAAEMPFISMVRKGSAPGNTLLEYPIDKYDDARIEGVPDGKDADSFEDTQKNRQLITSRVMKQWRKPMVTDLAENVTEQAGDAGSKFAQAKAKSIVELKQDMEAAALGTQDSRAQTDSQTGSLTRGLGTWIQTTAQSDQPVPAAYRPATGQINTGTLAAFEEDELRAMLQARYETVKAAGDLVGIFGTSLRNKISDFSRYDENGGTKASVRRFNGGTSEITTSVDIYRGDYGVVRLFNDLFLPSQLTGYILDMNKLELRATRQPNFKELPDMGGGPRGIIDCIWALCNTHPQAHCKAVVTV